MQYNNINNLSMTGGDDFTDISQILERCVLLDVNQTILSNKIFDGITNTQFDGDVELNAMTTNTGTLTNTGTIDTTGTLNVSGTFNLTTDIVADKASLTFSNTGTTIINPQNICALQVAGTDKFVSDMMNTSIYGTSQLSLSGGGSTTTMTSANFANNFGTAQRFSVSNNEKLAMTTTATTLNNTTTNIQSGASNKITTNATTTTLNNDTTNIQSGATNRITTNSTNTTLNNGTTTIQSGGTAKITTNATINTLNNDTTIIQSGGFDKITTNATINTLTNETNTITSTTGNNTITSTSGLNIMTSGVGGFAYGNEISCSGTGSNKIISGTGGNNYFFGDGVNTLLTNGVNSLESSGTSAISNKLENTTTGGNTLRVVSGTNTIQNTGGSNLMTALTTGTNTIQSVSGKNLITSTSGLIELTTANTTANGILIKNTDTTTGGIRIENDGATGGIVIDTASGADMTLSQGGSTKFSISGAGASQATNISGGITTIGGTTTNIQSTSQPLTLTTTTGGKIEIKSNVLTSTGINIENTNTTTGGITLKTNGSTGDINLTSSDDVILTASSGQITLSSPIVSASTKYQITTNPLVSFALTLVPQDYNGTNSQLLIGYPDANTANVNNNIRFPYRTRVVGWSVSGDTEAHSGVNITLTVGTALAGGTPTRYFRQTGTLSANALQNNSAMANIIGTGNNMTSITTDNDAEIPQGTRVYFYENTSANMACEMMFVIYFQQVQN
tara:strand:+ start:495 stop:2699 length:2205 start_codon:yes stop_codon:yes gene_type:complete